MRVVVALGGNALLQRGRAAHGREPARERADRVSRRSRRSRSSTSSSISHGNGPQVGLLALQGSAYTAVEPYPLDVLGAQTEGMIGYILAAGARQRAAARAARSRRC